jgi:hypothetical protein
VTRLKFKVKNPNTTLFDLKGEFEVTFATISQEECGTIVVSDMPRRIISLQLHKNKIPHFAFGAREVDNAVAARHTSHTSIFSLSSQMICLSVNKTEHFPRG